jgi:hypothetical protein
LTLTLEDASDNTWSFSGSAACHGTTPNYTFSAGGKALSGALDRIRILSSTGDTFDAGSINIAYK